jgi:hypothetical protein
MPFDTIDVISSKARAFCLFVYIPVFLLALAAPSATAQCSDPGLKLGGHIEVEGSFGHNGTATKDTILPPDAIALDTSFHQASLKAYGGGSAASSPLQSSQIPAGICIVTSGTEDHEKGWAISEPVLFVASDDGERVTRRGFRMYLYCTVGSNELDKDCRRLQRESDGVLQAKGSPNCFAQKEGELETDVCRPTSLFGHMQEGRHRRWQKTY